MIHIPTSRSGKNLSLDIYYQNVRGIRTKLKDLVCGAPLIEYDILVFTETWLINTIYDAELGLTDFDIYRNDRCEITQDSSRGGGVLIAVRKNFNSKKIKINNTSFETLYYLS